MTSRHSIACSSSHLRNLKECCSTKDGFRCVHLLLTNGLKYNPKNPKSVSPLDQFITHVIIPANTGQIEALEAGVRPGFKTWSHRTQICLWLRIKKKEGDKRIYNPAEVCPRYSPTKIEVYKSFQWFKVQVLSKMENGKI